MVSLISLEPHLDPVFRWIPQHKLMERKMDFYRAFRDAIEFALKERPDLLLFPGDLFFRVNPRIPTLAKVVRDIKEVYEKGVKVYAIAGHHDQPRGVTAGASPLTVLHNAGYLHFFKSYHQISKNHLLIDGLDVCVAGVSYKPDVMPGEDPLEGVDMKLDGQVNILMLHYNIEGFHFFGNEPVVRLSSIPENVQLVAAGHLHRHQHQTIGETVICYCGSTERVTFAEEGEPKGFVYMDVDREGVQHIEHVETHARPMKTIEVYVPKEGDVTQHIIAKVDEFLSHYESSELPLLRIKLYGTFTRPVLRTYRRDIIIRHASERCFAVKLDDDEVKYATHEEVPEVRLESPLKEFEKYVRALIEKAKSEKERRLYEEVLKFGRKKLEEAGAW